MKYCDECVSMNGKPVYQLYQYHRLSGRQRWRGLACLVLAFRRLEINIADLTASKWLRQLLNCPSAAFSCCLDLSLSVLTHENVSLCYDRIEQSRWLSVPPSVRRGAKTLTLRFSQTPIDVINVKLFVVILPINLNLFMPLSVTLTIFQSHSSVKQF